MPTGTPGDDVFVATSGQESFDGEAGSDTVSYVNASTGINASLTTGTSSPYLRVMPLGDSITYGMISAGTIKDTQSGGWRPSLWNRLQTADLAIDYVGSLKSGPMTLPDRDNQGFQGKTIDYLDSVYASSLAAYKPDVILLMIGTNDTYNNSAVQMITELRSLLQTITTASPGTTVFVSTIPPTYDVARNMIVNDYNAAIPGLVAELHATAKVEFVDNRQLTLADITPPPGDVGVHPTAAGYEKIAANWYDALSNAAVLGGERDNFVSIENLTGSNFNDHLVGDAGANVLSGLAGVDELIGNDGNDTLDGGAGIDRLVGGTGDDTYLVDTKYDVVVENAGEGTDTIQTALVSYSLAAIANVENLTFVGTANATLVGNAQANSLTGGIGRDSLDGSAGADIMAGGLGNDSYVVDNVGDTVIEASGAGTDTIKAWISFSLAANVEALTLMGTDAIDGVGNELGNTLSGNFANNLLQGLGGNDVLNGWAGDDRLEGGDGNDTLRGGNGTDVLVGGAGADRFSWWTPDEVGVGVGSDRVLDFIHGADRLDFSRIDAVSSTTIDETFQFIGTAAFTNVAGQLRFELIHDPLGDFTVVQGDVNGDGIADLEAVLVGYVAPLVTSDFYF